MESVCKELRKYVNKGKLEQYKYFHKTDKGGYAEQDLFLGISVPDIKKVAKEVYNTLDLNVVQQLLESKYHEERMCGLCILVFKIKKADRSSIKEIVDFYLANTKYINGWELVDLTAPDIIGTYVLNNPDKVEILYKLSASDNMWEQRIAIVSNWTIIKEGNFFHIIKIADEHLTTPHDLIQKAVGWMLREVGKRNYIVEYNFLKERYKRMPRTMLRYSIEKFDEETRQKFLKGEI